MNENQTIQSKSTPTQTTQSKSTRARKAALLLAGLAIVGMGATTVACSRGADKPAETPAPPASVAPTGPLPTIATSKLMGRARVRAPAWGCGPRSPS